MATILFQSKTLTDFQKALLTPHLSDDNLTPFPPAPPPPTAPTFAMRLIVMFSIAECFPAKGVINHEQTTKDEDQDYYAEV